MEIIIDGQEYKLVKKSDNDDMRFALDVTFQSKVKDETVGKFLCRMLQDAWKNKDGFSSECDEVYRALTAWGYIERKFSDDGSTQYIDEDEAEKFMQGLIKYVFRSEEK